MHKGFDASRFVGLKNIAKEEGNEIRTYYDKSPSSSSIFGRSKVNMTVFGPATYCIGNGRPQLLESAPVGQPRT